MTEPRRRIIISLTTIPSRAALLEDTLRSVANQTLCPDAVYVAVPKYSKREKVEYPIAVIKRQLMDVFGSAKGSGKCGESVGGSIVGYGKRYNNEGDTKAEVIVLDEDFGPLTKLMGVLLHFADVSSLEAERTYVITVDDDQLYDRRMVETLVRGAKTHPGHVTCLCGHVMGKKPPFVWGTRTSRYDRTLAGQCFYLKKDSRVDVIAGWCGVCYTLGMFRKGGSDVPHPFMEDLRTKLMPVLHRYDDLYISAWLDLLHVPKTVVAYSGQHDDTGLAHAHNNALSTGNAPKPGLIDHVRHFREFSKVACELRSRGILGLNDDVTLQWFQSGGVLCVIAGGIGVAMLALFVLGVFRCCKRAGVSRH